ncbi:hypothetical protein BKA81DRAFT_359103 [Phyllosticta paracitricarpa]
MVGVCGNGHQMTQSRRRKLHVAVGSRDAPVLLNVLNTLLDLRVRRTKLLLEFVDVGEELEPARLALMLLLGLFVGPSLVGDFTQHLAPLRLGAFGGLERCLLGFRRVSCQFGNPLHDLLHLFALKLRKARGFQGVDEGAHAIGFGDVASEKVGRHCGVIWTLYDGVVFLVLGFRR